MTFWERFYNLCLENNTKPNPLGVKLGIPSATIAGWKKGSYPNAIYLEKLSDYFGVSVDYLLGKSDIKKEQAVLDEQPASEELKRLREVSSTLSDEEVRKALEYVEFLKSQRK